MGENLWVAGNISTSLSLAGLIAALAYYAYSRRLRSREKLAELLPPGSREKHLDDQLTRYGIDGTNLTREQKNGLISAEMDRRYRLARLYVLLGAVVFVTCFALVVIASAVGKPTPPSTPPDPDLRWEPLSLPRIQEARFDNIRARLLGSAVTGRDLDRVEARRAATGFTKPPSQQKAFATEPDRLAKFPTAVAVRIGETAAAVFVLERSAGGWRTASSAFDIAGRPPITPPGRPDVPACIVVVLIPLSAESYEALSKQKTSRFLFDVTW